MVDIALDFITLTAPRVENYGVKIAPQSEVEDEVVELDLAEHHRGGKRASENANLWTRPPSAGQWKRKSWRVPLFRGCLDIRTGSQST